MLDKALAVLLWVLVHNLDESVSGFQKQTCSVLNSTIHNGLVGETCSQKKPVVKRVKRVNGRALVIPIGTIFNSDDIQMRSAFRLALSQFSKESVNYKLNQSISIIEVSDNFKLASSLCSQMNTGVFLFFGTKSIHSLEIIDHYTKRFHMPYISPSLSRVAVATYDSFQVSMKPPITQAIIDLIINFDWQVVHYLYDSNEGLKRLQEIFSTLPRHTDVRFTYRKLEDVYHAHEDLRTLDRMNTADDKKIILDLSSYDAFTSVLKQIAEVGMNKHEYFYLLTTLDFSRLDFRRFIHGGVNLTGFDIIDPNNKQYKRFVRKWENASTNEYRGAGGQLMSDSALAVDSLHVITETFSEMLSKDKPIFQGSFRRASVYNNYTRPGIPCTKIHHSEPEPPPWMHGQAILDTIKMVDFQGLTGHVMFTPDGFRHDYILHVSSVGLHHQTPTKIGSWHPDHGYSSLDADTRREPVGTNFTDSSVKVITTILSKPMLMRKDPAKILESNLTGNDIYEGFVPDFAKLLSERIGFQYRLKEVTDGNYGRENPITKEWDGMVKELIDGTADMALADFTITYDRERVVDFTKPFMEVGISIMIKKPEIEKPGVFSFMKPFNFKIWIFIMLAYGSVSIGLFLVSRFSPYEWTKVKGEKDPQLNEEFSMLNSFWFSTGALMLQGSDSCPRSISGRVIGTVWWFFVLIIISSYTANLAAFLTIERMVAPIETVDDLAKQTQIKYGSVNSGTTREFFAGSLVPIYQTMWAFMMSNPQNMCNTTSEGIERVRSSKGKYAFLVESNIIEYENSVEPCDTFKVDRNLNTKGFGVATPKHSPLRDVLNLHVLELTEDSTLIKLRNKWWTDRSQCAPNGGKDTSRKNSLSLSNVAGVFYILICGLVVAVIYGALSFIILKVRLIPITSYAKAMTSSTAALETDKGNGSLSEYAINNGHSHSDRDVKTYTYNPPPMIGFEAFQQPQEQSDV
ncbi:Hypothetical predicted protein [Mytilus galloprovincialis]|uniref:Uncharacterized protein n=1 Tax=Mytilus galloprovincialis TaxID=29158 RepID=A0A8B6G924_MYTGA|nr:Hypothetical predicted protein [Mytilus galloprovincialis]